ncbi:hypothetical protein A6U86_31140 [Rhizobium sp. AC27/96]|nr:hypothetical protein A6U86_31140 [Rhizobium sp. AC27/96]
MLSGDVLLPAGDPPTFGIAAHMITIHGAVQQKLDGAKARDHVANGVGHFLIFPMAAQEAQ